MSGADAADNDRAAARDELLDDLAAEYAALDELLSSLSDGDWRLPTPAPGWDIRDQVTHLAFFDGAAARSVARPQEFAAEAEQASRDHDAYHDAALEQGRQRTPTEALVDWREQTSAFRTAAAAADPAMRCNWFVTQMGLISLISARLMETWAHGQDVRDTVGQPPEVSDRLRHVAFLAANAMPYAFMANGLDRPSAPVRVELELPSGRRFIHGPSDAADRVEGPALDFCLLATQRRHRDDLELVASGPVATAWLPIAQAFAGPPGPGRAPGQFDD